jgi:adenosylhomocysteine nucleosidase
VTSNINARIEELLKPATGAAEPRRCDLLLFVAIRSELEELLRRALEMGLTVSKLHGRESEYYNLDKVGSRNVMVVKTSEGPFSHAGSAAKAIHCLTETQASGMISVGMAFGTIPAIQEPGHILVSTGILAYDQAHVRATHTTSSYHDYGSVPRFPASASLLDEFRKTSTQADWKGKAHIGLMLSGAAKIYCPEFRDRLARKCAHGKGDLAIGGDMEAVGIASASTSEAPNWIVIKAISDFADHDRDKVIAKNRPIACYNAARFVLETLSQEATR